MTIVGEIISKTETEMITLAVWDVRKNVAIMVRRKYKSEPSREWQLTEETTELTHMDALREWSLYDDDQPEVFRRLYQRADLIRREWSTLTRKDD